MTATTETKSGACSIVTVERRLTAVIKAQVPMGELPAMQRSVRVKIAAALPSLNAGPLGHTCTLWRPATGGLYMEPGVIVARAFEPAGEVVCSVLPAGRTAHFKLVGSFAGLPGAWQTLLDWCAKERLKRAGTNWEIYGDTSPDPAKQETFLHVLLA